jgi:adenosylcobyric acid synthase
MGRTRGGQPWIEISEQSGEPISVTDGAVSGDGRVWGCYLHGLFENEPLRRAWLSSLGWRVDDGRAASLAGHDAAFERLAGVVEAALDVEQLDAILWGRR